LRSGKGYLALRVEEQLAELARLGIGLAPGVTVEDLLRSFHREWLEERPFELLLSALGGEVESEPWGRRFSRQVWCLDLECIECDGAYVRIVQHLGELAGATGRLVDVRDRLDLDEACLEYTLDGELRQFDIEVMDDWADPKVLRQVMADLEGGGKAFYAVSDNQVMTFLFLDEVTARSIERLTNGALERLVR
jgi:hypothetical protein